MLIANSNLVGRWATWEHFHELEKKGLMMYGQMTAGSWIYIGTQGILQGTYETFAQAGRTHFGSGGPGRAAGALRRPGRHGRRAAAGRHHEQRGVPRGGGRSARAPSAAWRRATWTSSPKDLDEALALAKDGAAEARGPRRSRVIGNAADGVPRAVPARASSRTW